MKLGLAVLRLSVAMAAVLAVSLVSAVSAGATALPSQITENMTLTPAASPYTGSPTIEAGATVTVQPGTKLTLGELTVKGTIKAEGTGAEPVLFGVEGSGRWGGIVFKAGSGASILDHVEITRAGNSFGRAIQISDSSPTISNSTIRESTYFGIEAWGSSPHIHHNTIKSCGSIGVYYGAEGKTTTLDIHDNTIEKCGGSGALFISTGANTTVASLGHNTLRENSSLETVYYQGGPIAPDIDTNTLIGNTGGNYMNVSGYVVGSPTWSDPGVSILIGGKLEVPKEATLTIEPGASFMGGEVVVNGTLKAEGTAEDPVLFTRAGSSKWNGITFNASSGASVLDHVEVDLAGASYGQAIRIKDSSPTISNSTISNSTYFGIYANGGAPNIHHNTVRWAGGIGIYYGQSETGGSGTLNIHDNTIEHVGSSGALFISTGAKTTAASLGGNTLRENSSLEALYYQGGPIAPDITSNTLIANAGNHMNVSGYIVGSGTWSDPGAPVLIGGELNIPAEATLSIEPGVTVIGGGVVVDGTLKAEGTAEDPVVFDRAGSSKWNGITFNAGSGASVLDHVEILHAGASYGQAIRIKDSSPTIANSTIRESTYFGIYANGGAPDIHHNTINLAGGIGIYYGQSETGGSGTLNIHDNTIEHVGSSGALFISTGAKTTAASLGGNTLRENSSLEALYYQGGPIAPDIDSNRLIANVGNHMNVSGSLAQSGTWSDPNVPILIGGKLEIPAEMTLSVEPGVTLQGGEVLVNGTLKAEGTAEEPVVFTRAGSSKWNGITFNPGSGGSVLDHAEVLNGGASWGRAILIKASPTITHSAIRNSTYFGIQVSSGSPTIEWNRFRANSYHLVNETEATLSAPHNDWGCKKTAVPPGCVEGTIGKVAWEPAAELTDPVIPCDSTSAAPGPNVKCLLSKYEPVLKFDSQESYSADSAAMITENWGDETGLWGGGEAGAYGNLLLDGDQSPEGLAVAGPRWPLWFSNFRLTMSALGTTYPDASAADENDWIDEVGEDYVEDAHGLETKGYKNRAYGRLFKDGSGKLWLQYWFFYYYNSYQYLGFGVHEGDWETVEIGLDSKYEPDQVIYSQHGDKARCEVGEWISESGVPAIFVAVASHANYPHAGVWSKEGPGTDRADGAGATVRPSLEVLGGEPPSWVTWPGHWGNSRGFSDSPRGPAFQGAWTSPDGYAAEAHGCEDNYLWEAEAPARSAASSARATAAGDDTASSNGYPPPTIVSADLEGRHPHVRYEVPGEEEGSWPRLVLSVNERGDGLLSSTKVIPRTEMQGEVTLPYAVDPEAESVVLASLIYRDGQWSEVVRRSVSP